MKILHTYCLNFNIGDYALGIGVKNLLREYLSVDLISETNIQGREFNHYYINEVVNKKYDLLVIGGGGIIHGSHWPNGWFWLIDRELIKQIKIPFIVYGVGYNYWVEEGGIPERGIRHLMETKNSSSFFSVRNDGSASRILKQTRIKSEVVPDPGFHVNLNTKYSQIEKSPYVIIQLANDKPEKRFGNLEKRNEFVSSMKKVTIFLAKKYKVVFAPHVWDDIELSNEISNGIDNTIVWDFGSYAFDKCDIAIGYYKYAEFVIAMRGHGQIIPIGFNVPVISLENHPKHKGLMVELDLLEYNLSVSTKDLESRLIDKVKKIESEKIDLIKRYKRINKELEIQSKNGFKKILRSINGS